MQLLLHMVIGGFNRTILMGDAPIVTGRADAVMLASDSAEMDTVTDVQSEAASRGEPSLIWTDPDLLQYLANAWDQYDASHIQVIGRLRVAEEKTFGFLEELHHAETGIKLAAPSSGSKVHLGVFVPPPEIINFREQWKEASYAVAALVLSSWQRREERNDPFACTVIPGFLAALSHVPTRRIISLRKANSREVNFYAKA